MNISASAKNKPIYKSIEYSICVESANEYQEDMILELMYASMSTFVYSINGMHKKNKARYSVKYTSETNRSIELESWKLKVKDLKPDQAIQCKSKQERLRIIELLRRSGIKRKTGDQFSIEDGDLRYGETFCVLPYHGSKSSLRELLLDNFIIHDSTKF